MVDTCEAVMPDLYQRLRTATAGPHAQLDALPFFQALRTGALPKIAIVSLLRSLAIVHAVLERSLSQVTDEPLRRLVLHAQPKVPLLDADLKALRAASAPSITPALRCALDYGAEILTTADNPLSLVGTLYVLEGSQLGGLVLKRAYAGCLRIPEDQLSYFGCYGQKTAEHWQKFVGLLNALAVDDEHVGVVLQSAMVCFARLGSVFTALYPYAEADLKYHVSDINFEAGDHAMPQDPLEIELALRAGRLAWEQYPYLKLRFSERGKRFTSSDSCWLVSLTRLSERSATKSLEWLRTVLATRGIPTVILESHLVAIRQALAEEFPECIERRTRFDAFLAGRDSERQGLYGVGGRALLIEEYDRRLRACPGSKVESAAQLIASAWVDDRCGLEGSLAAVCGWFVDASRFSNEWIACVNDFVRQLDQAGKLPC